VHWGAASSIFADSRVYVWIFGARIDSWALYDSPLNCFAEVAMNYTNAKIQQRAHSRARCPAKLPPLQRAADPRAWSTPRLASEAPPSATLALFIPISKNTRPITASGDEDDAGRRAQATTPALGTRHATSLPDTPWHTTLWIPAAAILTDKLYIADISGRHPFPGAPRSILAGVTFKLSGRLIGKAPVRSPHWLPKTSTHVREKTGAFL